MMYLRIGIYVWQWLAQPKGGAHVPCSFGSHIKVQPILLITRVVNVEVLPYWQYFLGIAAGIAIYFRCSIECGIAILLSTFFGNSKYQYFNSANYIDSGRLLDLHMSRLYNDTDCQWLTFTLIEQENVTILALVATSVLYPVALL
jgi:hypothetical protein